MSFTKHPNLISIYGIENLLDSKMKINNEVPARPVSYPTIFQRIKYAWMVFSGKADVLIWPGQ